MLTVEHLPCPPMEDAMLEQAPGVPVALWREGAHAGAGLLAGIKTCY